MIVSANQPYFAPHPAFFHKAHLSDCFVILDDVQFPRKTTWITRNRFKNEQGELWMTIPVQKKGLGLQNISEVCICHDGNWKQKHLRSFQHAYANAPYLRDHLGRLQQVLSMDYDRIRDVNMAIIEYVMQYLKMDTRVVKMSELGVTGRGQQLIIDICKFLGADQFLLQTSAMGYYDEVRFAEEGIELVPFKKPDYVYPQLWGDFIENLSVLDMMFNCGPKSPDIIFR